MDTFNPIDRVSKKEPINLVQRILPILKACILFLSLGIAFVLLHYGKKFGFLEIDSLNTFIKGEGTLGWSIFIILVAIFSALGVPRYLFATFGGYIFGALYGSLLVNVGLLFGCMIDFFYARFFASSAVQKRFGHRIKKLNDTLLCTPFSSIIAIRFFPVGSNVLTNIVGGLTQVPSVAFFAGSFIGYLPQTIIFSLLGSGVALEENTRLIISFLLFILSTGISVSIYKKIKKKQKSVEENSLFNGK